MRIRSVIFWIHLACGVCAGLVILMMSVTGVLLTYERQLTVLFDRDYYTGESQGAARLQFADFIAAARGYAPEITPAGITISSDPAAPVSVQLSRSRSLFINPYTGEILGEGAQGIRNFFHTVTGWHRWFNVEGEARETARAVTGACNLAFLFLVISGMYLWLPRRLKWPFIRGVVFFNPQARTAKARDYNWHHVFGIWSSIPLIMVIATAVVFSYPWANNLVFRSVGEEPPQRGLHGPPGSDGGNRIIAGTRNGGPEMFTPLSLDLLFERAAEYLDNWNTVTVQSPHSQDSSITFSIDQGNGGQPQKRHQLTLDRNTAEALKWEPFESQSAGRRARVYIRFLHTGEALGIIGQTIAGLVSLTSIIMVWTGLVLAWRRLIQPLFRKN
jgi:uncharacterized iron-regulated membrane protein